MKDNVKLSVIIPIYEVEPYISDCLDSVTARNGEDMEIICIYDGGTDGSWETVCEKAEKDSRIRLYENPANRGVAFTRNRGLDLARGVYVYFLDSDDMIAKDALSVLCGLADENRTDVIVFSAQFLFEEDSLRERFARNPDVFKNSYPGIRRGRDLFVSWIRGSDWIPAPSRYFYRRKFLCENRLRFPECLHEDEIFSFDVLMAAERVMVREERWYLRRFRKNSIMTGRMTMANVGGCVDILAHLSAERKNWEKDPDLKDAVFRYRAKIAEDVSGKFRAVIGPEREERFRVSEDGPRISVLIPVYNAAPYLPECLESVLSQDLKDIEILCVDDGSTDDSAEVLTRYARMDPRLAVFKQERNLGQAAARNRAISEARGEYLYMLDADDMILPGAFSDLYGLCKENDLDVIAFENRQFTDDPAFAERAARPLFSYGTAEGLYTGRDAFIRLVMSDILSPSIPTYLLKRAYLERNSLRFTEGILHEDIGYIFSMLLLADRVQLVHRPYFCRRFHSDSTVTEAFTSKRAEGYLKSWQKACEMRETLAERFGEDKELSAACRKWQRDVLGRIRMLYLSCEETLYRAPGGTVDRTTELLYEMLKETTTGRARAEEILGEKGCREAETAEKVFLCGSGQYLRRMLEAVGALEVEIMGILMEPGAIRGRKTLNGFRILSAAQTAEADLPVILATSHYNQAEVIRLLHLSGYTRIIHVSF